MASTFSPRVPRTRLTVFVALVLLTTGVMPARAGGTPQAGGNQVGTLDTVHYIPPFYAVSGLSDLYVRDHFLALSTTEATAFTVNIRNAAGTVNQNVTISRSSPRIVTLSAAPYGTSGYGALGIVDDFGLNQINTTDGLILTASRPFYANVRQLNGSQAESLTAKGQTARGTRFRAGFMHTSATAETNDHVRGHFIAVIATDDGTTVTFGGIRSGIVFRNGSGTLSGAPGPVTLDAGESYVIGVRLGDIAAARHNDLNGALVTSDKPIVVNTGSWTGGPPLTTANGQDVGFDQILPVSLVGTDYVLSKGLATGTAAGTLETPIVVADQDNTQIFVNGGSTPIATLNAGGYSILSGSHYTASDTMYIRASKPVSVYQTTAGANSNANVGMNFAVAISDAIQPQEVVIANAAQLGTATMSIVAPTGASITLTGGTLAAPVDVVGLTGYQIRRQTVSGNVTLTNSDKPLFVSVITVSGVATSAAYFSGVPNTYAVADTAVTALDTPVTIPVLANDNTGGGTFTIASATPPGNGTIIVSDDGTITYTPATGFSGTDTFTYTIESGTISDSATVTVTVLPNVYNFTQDVYSVTEGHTAHVVSIVSITRTGDLSIPGSIDVGVFAGADPSATPGVDLSAATVTVTFASGEAVKTVPIQILGDTDDEPDENASLGLMGPAAGKTRPTTTLVILNDDSPSLIAAQAAQVTVDEGAAVVATNTGTFSNAVGLSASLGTIADNGDGTWSWSYAATNGPLSESVALTATAANGSKSSASFQLTVNNVAPTAVLANNGPVAPGAAATVSFSGASDPSPVDTAAGFRYAYDLDNDGIFDVGDGTYIGSTNTPSTAVTVHATRVVRGRILDKDGGSTTYTTTIVVASTTPTTTTVTCPASVTYTGGAHEPCTAVVTGEHGFTQALTVTYANNVAAGTATALASFAGNASHEASSGSASFTIDKAASTTTVSCPATVPYTGAAQEPCTASFSTLDVMGPLSVSYTENTGAGTATASASYPGDANHDGSSDTRSFTIARAVPVVTATGGSFTYDGQPHGGACSATGIGGSVLPAATAYSTGTAPVNAGTHTITCSFAGDGNYNAASDTAEIVIGKATPVIHLTAASTTYTAAPYAGATCSAEGVAGASLPAALGFEDAAHASLGGAPIDAG
ncbi:MAG TPA: Ig-like domain-containing protein, partial [Vicinamibacterales bacterium]|nr:Ig-like domain-containing protein [Vicinamibacterales bacterium]